MNWQTVALQKERVRVPAVSDAQRRATAIAEHHPGELYGRNRGLLSMTHKQLHDFAATPEWGLPRRKHVVPRKKRRAI